METGSAGTGTAGGRPDLRVDTLLAGVAVRPFAQSAVRAGVSAASVDYFGDRDHRRDLPVLSLRRDAGAESYSAASLVDLAGRAGAEDVAYAADLENHPRLVGRLAENRGLLGNPPEVLRVARDPFRVAEILSGEGIAAPEVRRPDDLPAEQGPDGDATGWLRKPRRGGGGRGVRPWEGGALSTEEYLQEAVPGTPLALLFVADGERARLLAATEILVGRPAFGAEGFLYCGSLLRRSRDGRPLPPPDGEGELADARRIVSVLARRLGVRGLNGVDVLLDGGALRPVEVNPRWTSSMELLERGVRRGSRALPRPLFALHRRGCRGGLPSTGSLPGGGAAEGAAPGGAQVVGKAVVRARRDAVSPDLVALDGLAAAPLSGPDGPGGLAGAAGEVLVADLPEPGDPLPRGGPVCTLLASASGRAGCLERLEDGAARVHRALEATS